MIHNFSNTKAELDRKELLKSINLNFVKSTKKVHDVSISITEDTNGNVNVYK